MPSLRLYVYTGSPKYEMLEMYRVSLGVAVMPICVAAEKYSRILRQRLSSLAEPRWHSSTITRSKKSG